MFRLIRWRIAIPYIALILLTMAGLALYLSDLVRNAYLDDQQRQMTAAARLAGDGLAGPLSQGETLDPLARRYADLLDARVTVIGIDGTVLGESHEDRGQMDNHLGRPEVQQALALGQGSSIRFSRTLGYDMLYVAVPVLAPTGDRPVGLVRLARPLRQIDDHVAHLRGAILVATLLAASLAVLLALLIAERTARPIRQLTEVVARMAGGDLSARLLPTTRDEVGTLTHAFNDLAARFQEQMTTLDQERNRLAAVLDHMADGALITDGEGRVLLINPAATRLLGTAEADALHRSFAQVVRHHQLIEVWRRCREQGEEQAETIELGRQGPFLHVIVTPLLPPQTTRTARAPAPPLPRSFVPLPSHSPAQLVILQDLTQIRRLETVRRDFVSNISHELRTPLASLKALVDTLRDGALEDPPAAQRFLDRMEVEVDALTQMVQELLELSRIESGQVPLQLQAVSIAEAVNIPAERLRPQAERAGLRLDVTLPADLPPVLADAERIQQVVTNLVHNAIKFTPPGGRVTVTAQAAGAEVIVAVQDTGVGIAAEDLPRIFERFYKADRARAGAGTGLGLAIARHIIQAHGGRIWAESAEGRGSNFYFALPTATER